MTAIKPAILESFKRLGQTCANAAYSRVMILERIQTLRDQGITTMGDKRTCPLAQAFMEGYKGNGLANGTCGNYLTAIRRALAGEKFDLNPSQTSTRAVAVKGATPKVPLTAKDKARRLCEASDFAAFAEILRSVAKKNPSLPIDAVLKACANDA